MSGVREGKKTGGPESGHLKIPGRGGLILDMSLCVDGKKKHIPYRLVIDLLDLFFIILT